MQLRYPCEKQNGGGRALSIVPVSCFCGYVAASRRFKKIIVMLLFERNARQPLIGKGAARLKPSPLLRLTKSGYFVLCSFSCFRITSIA